MRTMKKLLGPVLSAALVCAALPRAAWAGLAPGVDRPAVSGRLAGSDRALETRMIRDKLVGMGVPAGEAESKLAELSDQDIHLLASNAEALKPGGAWELALIIAGGVLLALLIIRLLDSASHHH